jgi:cell wall-associated NlpC family hydrolase
VTGVKCLAAALVFLVACSRDREQDVPSPSPVTTEEQRSPAGAPQKGALREADIILHTSRSAQSKAIQVATGSRFSHMGIVHLENAERFVYEAVGPVKLTPFAEWVARGEGAHFVVMRLRDADQRLTAEALKRIQDVGRGFRGRPYDSAFEWSDDRIYCSELVWKIYKGALGIELGHLARLGDFDLTNPAVRDKLRERYGAHVPLDEPVISPAAIAESPLLEKVWEE